MGIREDVLLVERALAGEDQAWRELYDAHHYPILRICCGMVGPLAEDAAADIWLHLQTKLCQYRGQSKLSTWLHRVTVNTVNWMYIRRAKSRPQTAMDLESMGPLEPHSEHDEAAIVLRLDVTRALDRMKSREKKLLERHYLHGETFQEIARSQGRSAGGVKAAMHRAAENCREELKAST